MSRKLIDTPKHKRERERKRKKYAEKNGKKSFREKELERLARKIKNEFDNAKGKRKLFPGVNFTLEIIESK